MYDVVIVGSGIAGMTSAIYLARNNYKVLLLEKAMYGGQIVNSDNVENYPGFESISGFELSTKLYNQVRKLNVEYKNEEIKSLEDLKKYNPKSIILALGCESRKLDSVTNASYCALCDGPFYKDKIVAVVGGGNTALMETIFLSKYAKEVYLIHRRSEFRADKIYVNEINKINNIKLFLEKEVIKQEDSFIILDDDTKLEVDRVFVSIGKIPNTKFLEGIIDLDENGYIIAKEDCKTNLENVFVAGDTRTKEVRQLITAASDGACASISAIKYMEVKND